MARIRIDWKRIRLLPAEDVLVLLDRQAAGVLLSIMHIFEWQALFRVDDYDFADWDYLQEILSSAEEAIGNPLRIADLVSELQLMTNAIESLYCCPDMAVDITDGDQFSNPIEEQSPNGIPSEIVNAGWATDDDDWEGYLDYKCMVANISFDELKRKLGDFEQIVQKGGIGVAVIGTIAAIVGSLFGLGVFVLVAGVAAGIGTITALYDELLTAGLGFFENIAGALEAQRSDYIEALYCGDGPEGSYTDFLAVVDANLDVASRAIVRLMSMDIDLKILYGGRYDQTDVAQNLADAGYDVGDYTCICEPEAPPGYHLEFPSAVDFYVWHGNCLNRVNTYDAQTGLLSFEFDTGGGNQFEFHAVFVEANLWFDGYLWELVDHVGPTGMKSLNQQGDLALPGSWQEGQKIAGYHTGNHSGQDWDDWVAQYDHTANYSISNNEVYIAEWPNQTAVPITHYEVHLKIQWLVPD